MKIVWQRWSSLNRWYLRLKGHKAEIIPIFPVSGYPKKPLAYEVEVDSCSIGDFKTSALARKAAVEKCLCVLADEGELEGQQFKDRDGCLGFIGVHITALGGGGEVIGICRAGRLGSKVFFRKETGEIAWEYSILVRIEGEGN